MEIDDRSTNLNQFEKLQGSQSRIFELCSSHGGLEEKKTPLCHFYKMPLKILCGIRNKKGLEMITS